MKRRVFVRGLLVGTLGLPRIAPAQPARKVYRVGILGSSGLISEIAGPQPQLPTLAALLRGLKRPACAPAAFSCCRSGSSTHMPGESPSWR